MRNTLYFLEYGKKHSKTWKMRNPHSRNCNIARKLKKKTWKMRSKHFDMEYGEKL